MASFDFVSEWAIDPTDGASRGGGGAAVSEPAPLKPAAAVDLESAVAADDLEPSSASVEPLVAPDAAAASAPGARAGAARRVCLELDLDDGFGATALARDALATVTDVASDDALDDANLGALAAAAPSDGAGPVGPTLCEAKAACRRRADCAGFVWQHRDGARAGVGAARVLSAAGAFRLAGAAARVAGTAAAAGAAPSVADGAAVGLWLKLSAAHDALAAVLGEWDAAPRVQTRAASELFAPDGVAARSSGVVASASTAGSVSFGGYFLARRVRVAREEATSPDARPRRVLCAGPARRGRAPCVGRVATVAGAPLDRPERTIIRT